jgi:CRP-like cAMP-binding protein
MKSAELLFFCKECKIKSPEELEQVKCTVERTVKKYKKGDYIAFQGDKLKYLYMLTKGHVKTEIVSDSGLTISVEMISAPYPLAAAFIFAENNRFPVDVIALEDCEVVFITKESVEKQIARCPGFLRGFLAFSANRIQFLSNRLKIFSLKGIKAKIAYYILQLDKNGSFKLDKSLTALAEYFGVERPSLSRALSEMVSDGMIEFKSGKGKVLDYNKIKELLK